MDFIKTVAIVSFLLFESCKNFSEPKKESNRESLVNTNISLKQYSELEFKQKWDSLCLIKGCLVGGQRIWQGKWGGEGCAFSLDKSWQEFVFKTDKKGLTEFLINQIPDKTQSKLHTCPFDLASKGELAIYCLQGLNSINFYDLSPDLMKIQQGGTKKYKSEQAWIWAIQSSKSKTSELQNLWRNELNKSN